VNAWKTKGAISFQIMTLFIMVTGLTAQTRETIPEIPRLPKDYKEYADVFSMQKAKIPSGH